MPRIMDGTAAIAQGISPVLAGHFPAEAATQIHGALHRATANPFQHLFQRVFDNWHFKMCHLLQPAPAAREQSLALFDESRVELTLIEGAFFYHGRKIVGHNELGQGSVAADVAFLLGMQHFGIEHAHDVTQVEIAVVNFGHVLATDIAQVTLVALGHVSTGALEVNNSHLLLYSRANYSPRTSFIEYSPGGCWATNLAAVSAPCA